VQCITTEWPWAAFDQAKASFVAQKTSGGERVGRVEPWRVQRRSACERGQAGPDEPAAHVDEEDRPVWYASHIRVAGCF
jgi:hypothetical protein